MRRSLRPTPPLPFVLVTLLLAASGCGFFGYDAVGSSDAQVNPPLDTGVDSGAAPDAGVDCSGGACRRVFVTSAGLTAASVGSPVAADGFCQAAATGAGLGGAWKAWISDATTTAASRLGHAAVPYVLRDGTKVANDWADLVDGTIAHTIDRTEAGDVEAGAAEVWTATTASGGYSGASCANWTNTTSSMPFAGVGVTSTTSSWSYIYDQFCDRTGLRLYCFEQ